MSAHKQHLWNDTPGFESLHPQLCACVTTRPVGSICRIIAVKCSRIAALVPLNVCRIVAVRVYGKFRVKLCVLYLIQVSVVEIIVFQGFRIWCLYFSRISETKFSLHFHILYCYFYIKSIQSRL